MIVLCEEREEKMYTLMKNKNFALTKTIVEIESKEIELVSIRQLESPKRKKESPPGPVRAIEGCGEIHPPLCTIHDNQFSRVCFRIVEDASVSFPMDFETAKGGHPAQRSKLPECNGSRCGPTAL